MGLFGGKRRRDAAYREGMSLLGTDPAAAERLLSESAELGSPEAGLELGAVFEARGELGRAADLYREAYERGSAMAGLRFCKLFSDGRVAGLEDEFVEALNGLYFEIEGRGMEACVRLYGEIGVDMFEHRCPMIAMSVAMDVISRAASLGDPAAAEYLRSRGIPFRGGRMAKYINKNLISRLPVGVV